jgi:hypothetical protein
MATPSICINNLNTHLNIYYKMSSHENNTEEAEEIESLLFEYFDAHNNLEVIFGSPNRPDEIGLDDIPWALKQIQANAFGPTQTDTIAPHPSNGLDTIHFFEFITHCYDYDPNALTDTQINNMKSRIYDVIGTPNVDDICDLFDLYAVASIRDPGYDWLSYIMRSSNYNIYDTNPLQDVYEPYSDIEEVQQ